MSLWNGKVVNSGIVEKPTHTDILFGRGVGTNRHEGNTYFRDVVAKWVKVYAKCTKTKKMEISRGIVEHIRTLTPPGRFLEKDPLTLFWKEVDAKRAHEKTAQALRDGAAPMRKRFSDETAADSVSSKRAKKSHKKMRVTSTEPPILSKTEELEEIIDVKLHLQSPIFSETSIYSWLLLPEPPFKVTPIESPQLRVDEFGLPFHLVNCKENDVPMDMVDMRDDEIVRLWVAC